jgi:hypothetical protein
MSVRTERFERISDRHAEVSRGRSISASAERRSERCPKGLNEKGD